MLAAGVRLAATQYLGSVERLSLQPLPRMPSRGRRHPRQSRLPPFETCCPLRCRHRRRSNQANTLALGPTYLLNIPTQQGARGGGQLEQQDVRRLPAQAAKLRAAG